jgi:hypothetical protein
LSRRRIIGALALLLGIIGTVLIYSYCVPGADAPLNPAFTAGNPASSLTPTNR